MNPISQWLRMLGFGAADALAPNTCLVCGAWIGAEERRTCAACSERLVKLQNASSCSRCARTVIPLTVNEAGCGLCRKEGFWNLAEILRVGPYEPPLRDVVVRLKYHGDLLLAEWLGELLADQILTRPWGREVDLLVPVPMHWLRRVQRPCDHAALLAVAVGRRLRIAVRRAVVRRVRYAPSQTNTRSAAERFDNVRDCFAPRKRIDVRGKTVCLIDNLLVSGATLHELSKVLRRAGARRIYGAVAARSVAGRERQAQSAILSGAALNEEELPTAGP